MLPLLLLLLLSCTAENRNGRKGADADDVIPAQREITIPLH